MSNNSEKMKILVLGASGMLGNAILRLFYDSGEFEIAGTVRSNHICNFLSPMLQKYLISGVDVENFDSLCALFNQLRPDVVINCIGIVKQASLSDDPLLAIPINSLFPHRLSRLCMLSGARLVHISTDCVFSGSRGMYKETDIADAKDLYGVSKWLGEVDYANTVTLRTSIIGHELENNRSLIGWFLNQQGAIRGFSNAIFSGLPTVELARIIRDFVIPFTHLRGVYHVSAEPISKYQLLNLVAVVYGKIIDIEIDDSIIIDRSLDSTRFKNLTGFSPAPWPELIKQMYLFH